MSKTKKPKPVKFTFKKQPLASGLAGVGHPYPTVDVKLNKKTFGVIYPANHSRHHWTVGYAVRSGSDSFEWVFPRNKFNNEQEARDWLQANAEKIIKETLYFFEDDDQ